MKNRVLSNIACGKSFPQLLKVKGVERLKLDFTVLSRVAIYKTHLQG